MTDDEIVRKARSVFPVLQPEQKMIRELEVLAALRSVLTEQELARLVVLGLEALAEHQPKENGGRASSPGPA